MTNSGLLGPLVGAIETARRPMLAQRHKLAANETRTRNALIDPILRALDWDVSDPSRVTVEYDHLPNGRVDYALLDQNGKAFAVIEAKKLDERLEPHRGHLARYAYESHPVFAVLTNGDIWELYSVEATDSDFHFIRREIISLSENEPIQSARALFLLWRLNVAEEQPTEESSDESESAEHEEAGRKERQREAGRKAAETRRRNTMAKSERAELGQRILADYEAGKGSYTQLAENYNISRQIAWTLADKARKRRT